MKSCFRQNCLSLSL